MVQLKSKIAMLTVTVLKAAETRAFILVPYLQMLRGSYEEFGVVAQLAGLS
jgi:hypothetical protein